MELDNIDHNLKNVRHRVEEIHQMCHTIVDSRYNIKPTITRDELLEYVKKCRGYFYEIHKCVHKILKIEQEIPKT